MLITCPSCQKPIDIETEDELESLICSQCGSEFSPLSDEPQTPDQRQPWIYSPDLFASPPFLSTRDQTENEAVTIHENTHSDESSELIAPVREQAHLWPWFFTALLVVTLAGIWTQQEAWLDNRWMRSTLINLTLPLENREKDWLILPQSVKSEWVIRDDNSRVMVISGTIKNLLASSMPYPDIEVTFYANQQPDRALATISLPITEKPAAKSIVQTPFVSPKALKHAAASSQTEFILVIESMPDGTGDFTLSANVQ